MKRNEIEVGVEYAEHGPMAYGNIPSKSPARVRFLGTDPQERMLKTFRKTADKGWVFVSAKWSKDYAMYDNSLHVKEAKNTPVHGLFTVYFPSEHPSGALPGEVTYDGGVTWHPHPVAPAAVHMTWVEYTDQQRVQREAHAARQVNNAPIVMARGWRDVVVGARLLNMTHDELVGWINKQLDTTVL